MTRILTFLAPTHRKELERFSKFLVVGAIGFFVDTGILNLLVLGLHLVDNRQRLYAKTASFTIAVCSSFIWNRYWTYPDSRSKPLRVQLLQFFGVNIIGLGINLAIFGAVGNWLIPVFQPMFGATQGLALGTNVAQACAVGVVLFWNFFINRVWTYGDIT